MPLPDDLIARAERLVTACRARGLVLATAESCTGGLLAALITEIAGSSAAFDRGFVTYSNAAKHDLLGVPAALIAAEGAVSEACARAMAQGALDRSAADIAVSVTGIAGPGGGGPGKPVGLVHFACARRDGGLQNAEHRFGEPDRRAIRLAAVAVAVGLLEDAVG